MWHNDLLLETIPSNYVPISNRSQLKVGMVVVYILYPKMTTWKNAVKEQHNGCFGNPDYGVVVVNSKEVQVLWKSDGLLRHSPDQLEIMITKKSLFECKLEE